LVLRVQAGEEMAGGEGSAAVSEEGEMRSLALTPTWSVATVLTLLVAGSLLIERSIHRLSNVSACPNSTRMHSLMITLPAYHAFY
jgi:mlo protein